MEKTNKEEYKVYADNFFAKYEKDYFWCGLGNGKGGFFFDSPQGALAARISGRSFDYICTKENGIAFDSNYFDNISVESLGAFGYGLNVFTVNKEAPYPGEKKYDALKFNPIFFFDGKFPSNDYDKWHTFLNYDGLCAFLAMAPDKMLLDNKDFVINEIKRNASEEMGKVRIDENSADIIKNEIGEKYLELSAIAFVMINEANERLMMEEAEQAKFDAEQEALEKEYEEDVNDNFADMANAYSDVMRKMDNILPNANDEKLLDNE